MKGIKILNGGFLATFTASIALHQAKGKMKKYDGYNRKIQSVMAFSYQLYGAHVTEQQTPIYEMLCQVDSLTEEGEVRLMEFVEVKPLEGFPTKPTYEGFAEFIQDKVKNGHVDEAQVDFILTTAKKLFNMSIEELKDIKPKKTASTDNPISKTM